MKGHRLVGLIAKELIAAADGLDMLTPVRVSRLLMRLQRFVLVILTAFLVVSTGGLTSLAHASPPDASWIPGVYDAADYDDVVILITLGVDAVRPVVRVDLGPTWQVVALAQQPDANAVIAFILPSSRPRAPPAQ